MSGFICPICKKALRFSEKTAECEENHSFDISKSGYVNLLLSQKSNKKRHGDDKMMALCRQSFLNRGYYGNLLELLREKSLKYSTENGSFLDLGCGECYYSKGIEEFFKANKRHMDFYGVDISKDILSVAAKRKGGISLAVASVSALPFSDGSLDMVLNVFAPNSSEVLRVLKKGGILIKAIPLKSHLLEIKEAVYDSVYLNKAEPKELEGFEIAESMELKNKIFLANGEDIENLFKMTPYYYKTSKEDQQKLLSLGSLNVSTEFGILIYKKI